LDLENLEWSLFAMKGLPGSADGSRWQLDGLHVSAGGTNDVQRVLDHLRWSVEEGYDVHVVLSENQIQKTAHAQPVQTINAAAQAGNGQLGDPVLPLKKEI